MKIEDSKHHSRAIYIDTESTFWAGPPPPGLTSHIIEIGIVEMDLSTLTITGERSHFVRPKHWEVSDRCTDLTGITSDDIRTARTFSEVLASVAEEFSPSTAMCCTWGDDASLLAASCKQHKLRSPLRHVFDLAPIFQSLFVLKQRPSLQGAIAMLGLKFEGVPHGALPDARNTALLHAAALRRMRQEPEPLLLLDKQTIEAPPVTSFGEKLRFAIGKEKSSEFPRS